MPATLTSLRIRNLALVEELDWRPGRGFIAVTGETGSGKSIILGALKLILGERAEKALIRTGSESCTVEAVFDLRDSKEASTLNPWLEEQGVEPCEGGELIVKRTFSTSGSNRQFVNGSPTTLAVLKMLGDSLVDLHGPHDHQSLLSVEKQLDLLDAYAGAVPLRRDYEAHYRKWNALAAEHASLANSEAAHERELDLLRHQSSEIEEANLQPDEEAELLARYQVATNSRRLVELATKIAQRLADSDDALITGLSELTRLFRELEKLDPATSPFSTSYASALSELEDVAQSLERYATKLELDPQQLAKLEERVSLIETLKRKYGPTVPAVIAFGEEVAEKLRKIESRGEELERLAGEIATARGALLAVGEKLSGKRMVGAVELGANVSGQLHDLGFKKSEFEIALIPSGTPEKPSAHGLEATEFLFTANSDEPAKPLKSMAHGLESTEFLFSPNPGEPPKPLKSIGSSGEISRVMLAVKSALAGQDKVALMVFDEIDANVGGEIAHNVGAKMRSLGKKHQVLVITHLPPVAAAAESHFVVTKEFRNERTISLLTEVSGAGRQDEIARMLGGVTSSARAHAKELLKRND